MLARLAQRVRPRITAADVAEIREARGFSQTQLASQLCVSVMEVSAWEAGAVAVPRHCAAALDWMRRSAQPPPDHLTNPSPDMVKLGLAGLPVPVQVAALVVPFAAMVGLMILGTERMESAVSIEVTRVLTRAAMGTFAGIAFARQLLGHGPKVHRFLFTCCSLLVLPMATWTSRHGPPGWLTTGVPMAAAFVTYWLVGREKETR